MRLFSFCCVKLLSAIRKGPSSVVFFLRAEILNTTLALSTTKFLAKEVEYMPWEAASRNLNYFYLMFDRSEVYGPMQVSAKFSSVAVHPLWFSAIQWKICYWRGISEFAGDGYNMENCQILLLRLTSGSRWLLCLTTSEISLTTGLKSQRRTLNSKDQTSRYHVSNITYLNIFNFICWDCKFLRQISHHVLVE